MFELDQISLDDLPKGPGARIVRAADVDAWQDGYRFLAEVRSAAQRIEETAPQAHSAQFGRDLAEGRMAGASEASRLISETTLKVDRYLRELEREISALALNVVRRVLGKFDVADIVASATVQALDDLRRQKWLKVTVHPVAIERVRIAVATLTYHVGATLTAEADPSLDHAACV